MTPWKDCPTCDGKGQVCEMEYTDCGILFRKLIPWPTRSFENDPHKDCPTCLAYEKGRREIQLETIKSICYDLDCGHPAECWVVDDSWGMGHCEWCKSLLDEREACAKACIGAMGARGWFRFHTDWKKDGYETMYVADDRGSYCIHHEFASEGRCEECCADAIRARSNK